MVEAERARYLLRNDMVCQPQCAENLHCIVRRDEPFGSVFDQEASVGLGVDLPARTIGGLEHGYRSTRARQFVSRRQPGEAAANNRYVTRAGLHSRTISTTA